MKSSIAKEIWSVREREFPFASLLRFRNFRPDRSTYRPMVITLSPRWSKEKQVRSPISVFKREIFGHRPNWSKYYMLLLAKYSNSRKFCNTCTISLVYFCYKLILNITIKNFILMYIIIYITYILLFNFR